MISLLRVLGLRYGREPRMTRDHLQTTSILRRAQRLAAGTALAVGFIALGVAVPGDSADAAPRTSSASIADEAAEAIAALDRWTRTKSPADYVWFVQRRDRAASMTEQDIEVPLGTLREEWSVVSMAKQRAVLSAISQLGVPYRSLASEPGVAFDCSGLTIWAFAEAGVEIPRISGDQIAAAEQIDRESVEAGDLVYYPGHISIYLGVDMMVHSPNSGGAVEVGPVSDKASRFGDAAAADSATDAEDGSLMDRALAISE